MFKIMQRSISDPLNFKASKKILLGPLLHLHSVFGPHSCWSEGSWVVQEGKACQYSLPEGM